VAQKLAHFVFYALTSSNIDQFQECVVQQQGGHIEHLM